ncbi:glycosyltransferase family 2 protein [Nocardia sp. NPDC056000]|uniref:glycosyltransferase family 2 protein n=1 Tax=Nocardia sp. NPDC056000 TaxID=3345674 RepID=UPI0035DEC939
MFSSNQPQSRPLLSVVIPALNEEASIVRSLDRLVVQESIDEIIVVDNGSADATRRTGGDHLLDHPKVILIEESARGVAFARNLGFDKAGGDFIARTDADTLAEPDWE